MGFGVCVAGQGRAEPGGDLCSFVLSGVKPESARRQPWHGDVGWGHGEATQGLGPLARWDRGLEQRATSTGPWLGAEQGPASPQGTRRTPPASPLRGLPLHASCNQPSSPLRDTKMPFGGGKKEGIPKKKRWHPSGSDGACRAGPPQPAMGGAMHPKSPPGSALRPAPTGSPFSGITATAAALCLSPRGWPAAPEILLPSCKRKKKLIASSTRSSSRHRRRGAGGTGVVLSPWC